MHRYRDRDKYAYDRIIIDAKFLVNELYLKVQKVLNFTYLCDVPYSLVFLCVLCLGCSLGHRKYHAGGCGGGGVVNGCGEV